MAVALVPDKDNYIKRFFSRLDRRRNEGKHDFTILVGAQMIQAEQNVLSCGSDYFDAMFSHDTDEKQTGKVQMQGVDFESVKTCIDFIYGKDVSVLPEKYEDLMLAADIMQLTELCDAIKASMENNLNVKTFFQLKKIADRFCCEELQENCQSFAEDNFHLISNQAEFLIVETSFMKKLLPTNHSQVDEDGKLQIILKWIQHSREERKRHLTELVKCVDLSKLPPERGHWYIKNETLINTNNECLVHFSLAIIDAVHQISDGPVAQASLNNEQEILLWCRGVDHLQIFNTDNGIRNICCSKPTAKEQNFSFVQLHQCVYAFGEDKSAYCLEYLDKTEWVRKRDMLVAHGKYPPGVAHSRSIYLLGGHFNYSSKAVEKFDPSRNIWTRLADAPSVRATSCVLSFGEFIYSFGGFANKGCTNEVSRLNLATERWEIMAPMRERKGAVAAVGCNGLIFISGGYHKIDGLHRLSSFEQFDPLLNQWTALPSMLYPRYCHRLYAIHGALYAVGGQNNPECGIEKYDIEKEEWTVVEESLNVIDSVAMTGSLNVT